MVNDEGETNVKLSLDAMSATFKFIAAVTLRRTITD